MKTGIWLLSEFSPHGCAGGKAPGLCARGRRWRRRSSARQGHIRPRRTRSHPVPKDCSDFVGKVFLAHEAALPRSSEAMAIEGEEVGSSRDLRMADLVFFSGAKGGRKIGHVAIYVNNGIFIHQANSGEGVRQESMYSDYWRKRYLKGRRIVD